MHTTSPRSPYFVVMVTLFLALMMVSVITATEVPSFSLPTKIINANDTLTVSWSGVTDVSISDVITIHTIPKDFIKTNPLPVPDNSPYKGVVGFWKVFEIDTKFQGSGSFTMPIFSQVDTYIYFEYARFNPDNDMKKTVLFWSKPFDTTLPTFGFHLSYTHNATQYQLMYSSLTFDDAHWVQLTTNQQSINQDRIVIKNSTADGFFAATSSQNETYTIEEMAHAPANQTNAFLNPGYFRTAIISFPTSLGLDYYYRIRDAKGQAISRPLIVSSPMTAKNTETDVYLFGDSGVGFPFYTTTDQQQTASLTYQSITKLITEQRSREEKNAQIPTPTHILHIGDVSYARGWGFLNEYFFQQIEPLSSRFPYMISIGNHEYCYPGQPWKPDWHDCGDDSGGEKGVPTFTRWKMPRDFCSPNGSCIVDAQTKEYTANKMRNIAYSYDVNHIHFVVFTQELDFTEESAQLAFIEADLKQVDRSKTPWVILTAHRPPYCTTMYCSITPSIPEDQRKAFDIKIRRLYQPLMVKYNVNIGLWGHTHQYERFKLMRNEDYVEISSYVDPKTQMTEPVTRTIGGIEHIKAVAPMNIVSGAAGNEYNPPWQPYMKRVTGYSDNHHQTPEHVTFRTMNFGFSHFRANATHLTGKWYSNQDTTLHDHFVLEKVNGY